ncbi:MAG TPA: hypothetical protein VNE86_07820, partial [Nitrososphaerales archaeon]|nr:hypothetical protein [Nitrososphaerales archaeon]
SQILKAVDSQIVSIGPNNFEAIPPHGLNFFRLYIFANGLLFKRVIFPKYSRLTFAMSARAGTT